MILSMTGYGTGAAQTDDTAITVEIKTVNHRFLDLHIRVPREYQFLDGEIQQLIRNALDRGRVDVNVTVQSVNPEAFLVNAGLAKGYLEAAVKLREQFDLQDSLDLKTLLGLPGVVHNKEAVPESAGEIVSKLAAESVGAALESVLQMRKREGAALYEDMLKRIASVSEKNELIRSLSAASAKECYEKLHQRLLQLLGQSAIDPQRLVQEAALLSEKCDISEEIARLGSHVNQYCALMDASEKPGKKLDFLLQEMQREANTILSKSGNLEISRYAIDIKTDIEKLREQVQNVE